LIQNIFWGVSFKPIWNTFRGRPFHISKIEIIYRMKPVVFSTSVSWKLNDAFEMWDDVMINTQIT